MAITDKLNSEWNETEQGRLVFEFRALVQETYWKLQEVKARIDVIAADSNFNTVDAEIKAVGVALRTDISAAETAMRDTQAKIDFIDYDPPG